MTLTDLQRATIRAVVSLFETGSPRGDYARVTLAAGDTGGLSYGIHQATRASGNLGLLAQRYVEHPEAQYGEELRTYVDRLLAADPALDDNEQLKSILRIAGVDDPVMRAVQDEFFDALFFSPAIRECTRRGFEDALSACVVYDSLIHGSFRRIADTVSATEERQWVRSYIDARHTWLQSHPNALLRRTTYRTATLRSLTASNTWGLLLPLTVRGVLLTPPVFRGEDPPRGSVELARLLRLTTPPMRGDDVRAVQERLRDVAPALVLDGVYGPMTEAAARLWQAQHGLKPDGIVGPATRVVMGV